MKGKDLASNCCLKHMLVDAGCVSGLFQSHWSYTKMSRARLRSKINRLVVALQHKAAVCRMRKSLVSVRSQEREDADFFFQLQTALLWGFCIAKVRFGFKTGPVVYSWNIRWINQLNYCQNYRQNQHLGVICTQKSGKVELEWSLFWATPFFEQEFEAFYAASPQQRLCHTRCVL